VRDLWQRKDLGKFTGKFSAPVASHAVVMVTVKP
jgi:alpha-galactosidase